MNTHAKLAPSSAARWMQCPGSIAMCESLPEQEPSASSEEGTLAHEVIVAMFTGGIIPEGATEEMMDGAELWLDTVGWCRSNTANVESPVQGVHPNNWGTPDLWIYQEPINTLKVYDYKFGHRHVGAFENWQLLNYASGIIDLHPNMEHIELTIVQPRSYHKDGPVRTWRLTRKELMVYGVRLAEGCQAASAPDAPTVAGSECRDCPARHVCPTLQSLAYEAVSLAGGNAPFNLPPAALGREKRVLDDAIAALQARSSGLGDEILGRIKAGVSVPGWAVEQGYGREVWVSSIEEVCVLGVLMGIDISKPSAVTPKQAIEKGLPEELVRQYSGTPVGAIKLVADDGSKAAKAFN